MAAASSTLVHKQQQQLCKSNSSNVYENSRFAISESIKQLNEFANSINEVCQCARVFAQSIQTLESIAMPEAIGSSLNQKAPKKIFDSSAHLLETTSTLCEIMRSYSEKIKSETIDGLENFIVQVICPSRDELKGVYEHNKSIIQYHRDGFFSIFNHFFVLTAELMEKFLLCGDCSTPIGLVHSPDCTFSPLSQFSWRKKRLDDKYITYGMKFSFNELLVPPSRKNVLAMINKVCVKQMQARQNRTAAPNVAKSWPSRWNRGDRGRMNGRGKQQSRNKFTYPVQIAHPPIFNPSIWTPSTEDRAHLNYDVISFSYQEPQ